MRPCTIVSLLLVEASYWCKPPTGRSLPGGVSQGAIAFLAAIAL
ncbi:MAG: hypothetical protein VKJ46_06510 [Leptolyngbyaceae bacterium]|nr:hypothetical protein [Leptolyngbyaceae bacterium]